MTSPHSSAVSQYVLKISSRCDLSCDHCYVYEHADQSWLHKPKVLAEATARQAAVRISEHATGHLLDEVHVVLHGGEPLLPGARRLRGILHSLRSTIAPVTRLDLRIHTNGVLLDEELCELFAEYAVRVGVSLDGDRAANDLHRRFADGRSSHAAVLRAIGLLREPRYRDLYAGILCTVDLDNDPIAVYEALLAQAPPRLDLLLPHATWDSPPRRPAGVQAPYAAWLARIHERWLSDGRPVSIRLFDSLQAAWEGRPSGSEAAGLDPVDLLVIDTDGSFEQADSLKAAFDGAPATGFNVFAHSVDEAAAHPGVAARQAGLGALCQTCRECSLVQACGGGLYAHRYRSGNGFNNPSVYCDDLKVLIPQVTTRPRIMTSAPTREHTSWAGHSLSGSVFDLLAAGPGDRSAMTSLIDTRWSVNRALVAAVGSSLDGQGGDLGQVAADGWALLSMLDVEHPEAVREVLTYPFVEAWAMRCLRPATSADPDLDRAHLAGVAAAAALRAGIETELVLPVRDGSVFLPTVGALGVYTDTSRTSTVRISPSGLSSQHGARGWQAVRHVTAVDLSFTVEDVDPFRDSMAWAVTGRLSAAAWKASRIALAAAARQLAGELPAYARVTGLGLRAVVPLRPRPAGHRPSAMVRRAFGAVGLALSADVDGLVAALVHEMQHVKLAAVCDLSDLFDRADRSRYPVPWRGDRRTIEGVLHGAYAHLAVAELWLSRSRQTSGEEAGRLFLMYRSWVEEAIQTLLVSGSLTRCGDRFVNGMQSAVGAWAGGA